MKSRIDLIVVSHPDPLRAIDVLAELVLAELEASKQEEETDQ